MRNRREIRSRPISIAPVIALAILAAGIGYAQQNLPQPPAKERVADPAPGAEVDPVAGTTTAPVDAATSGTAPAKPAAGKGAPQRFEPTEKVRPDFDVAFPVDI
jgi:hypothetical protein